MIIIYCDICDRSFKFNDGCNTDYSFWAKSIKVEGVVDGTLDMCSSCQEKITLGIGRIAAAIRNYDPRKKEKQNEFSSY
jgi:hypothetical protein